MFKACVENFLDTSKKKKVISANLNDGIFVTEIIKKMILSNKKKKIINI